MGLLVHDLIALLLAALYILMKLLYSKHWILLVADGLLANALSLSIFNGRLNRTPVIVGKKQK